MRGAEAERPAHISFMESQGSLLAFQRVSSSLDATCWKDAGPAAYAMGLHAHARRVRSA
jgi:hypothetical protein